MNRELLRGMLIGTQQYLTTFVEVIWLGGFTFYALFVVRLGSAVVGGVTQGYITQSVMQLLHYVLLVMLGFMLLDMAIYWKTSNPAVIACRVAAWLVMALCLAILFQVHHQMSLLMDITNLETPDHSQFSPLHKRYQFVITFIWFASMFELGLLLHTHRRFALLKQNSTNWGPVV